MGKMKSEAILGWNGEEKVYKYMGFDSMGMMGQATGTVSGNTWSWTGEDKMGGKLIKSKYTIVMPSPTSQTFKWEVSDDGGKTWKTGGRGEVDQEVDRVAAAPRRRSGHPEGRPSRDLRTLNRVRAASGRPFLSASTILPT